MPTAPAGTRAAFVFVFLSDTSTFQLVNKPWSQMSSLLPRRFLPSIFIAHRVQQSHGSSIFYRVFLATPRSRAFRKSICSQEKVPARIYTSMHSGGFELTKLTYTRLGDNLITYRGDRPMYVVLSRGRSSFFFCIFSLFLPTSDGHAATSSMSMSSVHADDFSIHVCIRAYGHKQAATKKWCM